MSTLPLSAPRALHVPAIAGWPRFAAALVLLVQALVDAQDMARAAHKRYPFAES